MIHILSVVNEPPDKSWDVALHATYGSAPLVAINSELELCGSRSNGGDMDQKATSNRREAKKNSKFVAAQKHQNQTLVGQRGQVAAGVWPTSRNGEIKQPRNRVPASPFGVCERRAINIYAQNRPG